MGPQAVEALRMVPGAVLEAVALGTHCRGQLASLILDPLAEKPGGYRAQQILQLCLWVLEAVVDVVLGVTMPVLTEATGGLLSLYREQL